MNTHIENLDIAFSGVQYLRSSGIDRGFFDGLARNSSITNVTLQCNNAILVGGVFHEILKAYQENNEYITRLVIITGDLQNGGEHAIAETIRCCTNIQELDIHNAVMGEIDINDISMSRRQRLLPVLEAVKGHSSLEILSLTTCHDGTCDHCNALATLLRDSNSNLQSLNLHGHNIDGVGAYVIANSLINNTKLRKLYLSVDSVYRNGASSLFCKLICNTSSINATYSSNHSLEIVSFESYSNIDLFTTAQMNVDANKSQVAMKKILKYHPNIDMSPLFELDMKEDEQNLKGLPYAVAWLERAMEVPGYGRRKLSAIYHFAQAMPVLFVPPSHIKVEGKRGR